ncbi:hypothetical protein [Streptomyces sp. MS1.AVA.4]|uniref:Uncharacterized protein n=1 Tax=Streptomyces pratisoli TaxID=3139917 RepID=A0ACC6QVF5_9ACTN
MIPGFLRRRREHLASVRGTAHLDAQLRESADMAITAARRALSRRVPELSLEARVCDRERVDVQDVLDTAHEHFGLTDLPRERVAAVLRARYELRTGPMDLDTDAYDD